MGILRRSLDMTEAVLKFPLRILKKNLRKKSGSLEAANIAEDLIGVPFKIVRRYLERSSGRETINVSNAGPTLRNITVNPEVTVISDEILAAGTTARQIKFKVTGLLCDA